ncbi:MAG TPA: LPXTG cell wall anchor domain-containing protein [Mycobacteriales bacterium]|nr:LPXTG cell wall anchor domain-containing protein [Mycobacteriales bacterium]
MLPRTGDGTGTLLALSLTLLLGGGAIMAATTSRRNGKHSR